MNDFGLSDIWLIFCQPARGAQRINESGTEAICVGFMRTSKLFESCLECSIVCFFFPFSLIYDFFFGKINDLTLQNFPRSS